MHDRQEGMKTKGGRARGWKGRRKGAYHAAFQVAHVERVVPLLVLVYVAVPVNLVMRREGGREDEREGTKEVDVSDMMISRTRRMI